MNCPRSWSRVGLLLPAVLVSLLPAFLRLAVAVDETQSLRVNVATQGTITENSRKDDSGLHYVEFSCGATAATPLVMGASSHDFDVRLQVIRTGAAAQATLIAEDRDSGVASNALLSVTLPPTPGAATAAEITIRVLSEGGFGEFTLTWHDPAPKTLAPQKQRQRAIRFHAECARRAQLDNAWPRVAQHLLQQARLLNDATQFPQALEVLDSARALEGRPARMELELERCRALVATGDYSSAQSTLEELVQEATRLDRAANAGRAHSLLGNLALRTDRYPDARSHYLKALELLSKDPRGNEEQVVLTRLNLGLVQLRTGNPQGALEAFQASLAEAEEAEFTRGAARAHSRLGSAHLSLGKLDIAEKHCDAHLQLARQLGDRRGENSALGNLAIIALRSSQFERARDRFQEVRMSFQAMGVKAGEAQALGYLGTTQLALGDHLGAANALRAQLALTRELRQPSGEAEALGNLVRALRYLNQLDTALEHQKRRVELLRSIGNREGLALSQLELGEILNEIGQPAAARAPLEAAIAAYRQRGNRAREAYAQGRLGHAELHAQRFDKAQACYERQRQLSDTLNDELASANARLSLGEVALRQGQSTLAREHISAAMTQYRTAHDESALLDALYLQADAALAEGDATQALAAHDEAVRLLLLFAEHSKLERSRGRPLDSIYERWGRLAQDIAAACWKTAEQRQRCIDIALHWTQLRLTEGLEKSRLHERNASATELRRQWRSALAQRQGALQRHGAERKRATTPQLAELRQQLDTRTQECDALAADYLKRFPFDARLDMPPTVTLDALQHSLKSGERHLIYVEGRSRLYLYECSATGVDLHLLGEWKKLATDVEAYHQLLSRQEPLASPRAVADAAYDLSRHLLASIADDDASLQHVRLTLAPSLLLLPFATLWDPQQLASYETLALPTEPADAWTTIPFWIDNVSVERVPFPAWRPRHAERGMRQLLLGDPHYQTAQQVPDLGWTRKAILAGLTVEATQALPPVLAEAAKEEDVKLESGTTTLLLGPGASAELIATQLDAFREIVFGLHVIFDPDPAECGLLLRSDPEQGMSLPILRPSSLLRLPLRCQRLILTSTLGISSAAPAETVIAPLLHAGARQIVAPLWMTTVETAAPTSAATTDDAALFLQRQLSQPELRSAQLLQRQRSPHYWGGTILWGGESARP